jgi:uncharacterized protein (TIRG00374 family)
MTEKQKKLLFTSLRILICVVALAWVLKGVTLYDHVELTDGERLRLTRETDTTVTVVREGREVVLPRDRIARHEDGTERITYGLYGAVARSDPKILLLCWAIFAPVSLLQSLRFMWMLRAQEIHISYWESVKLSFAGNFLNFFALGTTGGDVVKAYYITLHTDQKTEAVTTVFLDRVIGLMGLLTTVGIVVFTCARSADVRAVGYFVAAGWFAGVLAAVLLSSRRLRSWLASRPTVGRLILLADEGKNATASASGRLRRLVVWTLSQGQRAERTTHRLLRHKPMVIGALLATIALQAIAVSDFVLICYALDMDFSDGKMWEYYAITSVGAIVAAIPITPQGLGTTEAAYKHFLLGSHGTLSQILCMAMGIRILQLSWALPGFLVTMTGAYKPRNRPDAVTATTPSPSSEA